MERPKQDDDSRSHPELSVGVGVSSSPASMRLLLLATAVNRRAHKLPACATMVDRPGAALLFVVGIGLSWASPSFVSFVCSFHLASRSASALVTRGTIDEKRSWDLFRFLRIRVGDKASETSAFYEQI